MATIETAHVTDAEEILRLQRLAYRSEADLYNDDTIPPLTQTLEELQSQFADHTFLKAVSDGVIVGSVRARTHGDTCRIARLIVHPDHQRQGIGSRLMAEIESRCPAPRYQLFTGTRSDANLRLYRKLGYRPFRTEVLNDNVTLVYMGKPGPRRNPGT